MDSQTRKIEIILTEKNKRYIGIKQAVQQIEQAEGKKKDDMRMVIKNLKETDPMN